MEKEFILGPMADAMRVTMKWTKSTDTENINGQMVANMKATGSMVNNMAKVIIS